MSEYQLTRSGDQLTVTNPNGLVVFDGTEAEANVSEDHTSQWLPYPYRKNEGWFVTSIEGHIMDRPLDISVVTTPARPRRWYDS